jgi:hypothetical protein
MNTNQDLTEKEIQSWQSLTLRQYIQIIDIIENENLSLIDKQVKILCQLEGKEESDFDRVKYLDFIKIAAEKTSFLKKLPELKAVDEINVNGQKFVFVHDLFELTAGQFIDINQFSGKVNELHKAASVFFLPVKGKRILNYGEEPFEKVAETLLDAKFIEIQGCLVFFYQLLINFVGDSEIFSKMTDKGRATMIHSLNIGVGNFGQNKLPITNEFPSQMSLN